MTMQDTLQEIDIHFYFLNKRYGTISSQHEDLMQLMDYFATTFSQVSIGYTEELETSYKRNPVQLKINPQRHNNIKITHTDNSTSNAW